MRRLYFSVETLDPKTVDDERPSCKVTDSTFFEQCADFRADLVCKQKRWSARFDIQDYGSGLRFIAERPRVSYDDADRFFSHDNFIAGSDKPVFYLYAGDCCSGISLNVMDVAGNEAACSAGPEVKGEELVQSASSSSTLTIVIVVAAVALVLVVLIAAFVVWMIKRKRQAELAEMRESPQAR